MSYYEESGVFLNSPKQEEETEVLI